MLENIKQKRQDGFTIIEVVIVLAIAGLIFLVVFLAVPQLQASRRDTQRRSDAGRLGAAIEQVAANSQGDYPADGAEVVALVDFASNNLQDPADGNADYSAVATDPGEGEFRYEQGGTCGTNGAITGGAGSRVFAVAIGLEGGGAACYDTN